MFCFIMADSLADVETDAVCKYKTHCGTDKVTFVNFSSKQHLDFL